MDWLTWQGIRALADAQVLKAGRQVRYVAPTTRADVTLAPGMRVYVRDAWRAPWRAEIARVPVPVTLLTTFSDPHVQPHATAELLDGTRVDRWFAVQVNTTHPKLEAMPIGIDGRDLEHMPVRTDEARTVALYLNFLPRNPERIAVRRHFGSLPWVSTRWNLPMAEYFADLQRARFVLSPPGRGWDCYRTYEALAMGAIPIVRRQPPISDVVRGLPVLMVDDWNDVTPERLAWEWAQRRDWNLERMTLPYWVERIRRHGENLQGA